MLPQNNTSVEAIWGIHWVFTSGVTLRWLNSGNSGLELEDLGVTEFVQSGHVECDWNYKSVQSTWNLWLCLGSSRAFSPSKTSQRHTTQISLSLNSSWWKIKAGRDQMTKGLSPLRMLRTNFRLEAKTKQGLLVQDGRLMSALGI